MSRITVTELESHPGQQWKCGDEFLPFHPSASHVPPEYRDGWNRCYWMAVKRAESAAKWPSITELLTAALMDLERSRVADAVAILKGALRAAGVKPWKVPGPDQPNPPLPRDLDPAVPHTSGDFTAGVSVSVAQPSPSHSVAGSPSRTIDGQMDKSESVSFGDSTGRDA